MTSDLLDPLRHNAWANRELLAFCRDLTDDDLGASVPGTFGSVIATFNHILNSEAGYLFRIAEHRPSWEVRAEDSTSVAVLQSRAEEMAALWDNLLRDPVDADRSVTVQRRDGTAYAVATGVILAQTLNHGNEHRAHIRTILGAIGRQPPDLDGWDYGFASGRAVWLPN